MWLVELPNVEANYRITAFKTEEKMANIDLMELSARDSG
jgi:hypothetical protein